MSIWRRQILPEPKPGWGTVLLGILCVALYVGRLVRSPEDAQVMIWLLGLGIFMIYNGIMMLRENPWACLRQCVVFACVIGVGLVRADSWDGVLTAVVPYILPVLYYGLAFLEMGATKQVAAGT